MFFVCECGVYWSVGSELPQYYAPRCDVPVFPVFQFQQTRVASTSKLKGRSVIGQHIKLHVDPRNLDLSSCQDGDGDDDDDVEVEDDGGPPPLPHPPVEVIASSRIVRAQSMYMYTHGQDQSLITERCTALHCTVPTLVMYQRGNIPVTLCVPSMCNHCIAVSPMPCIVPT